MRFIQSVAISLFLLATGCASMPGMPGHVSTHVSDYDGTREVYMESAAVPTPGAMVVYIQLGAHWTSESPDTITLIAETPQEITNIRSDNGLQFNIDSNETKLDSSTTMTDHDSEVISGTVHTKSSRPFTTSIEFVEKLADAKTAGVKLLIGQGEYYEARMESDRADTGIRSHLRSFLAKVREQKQAM